MFVVNKTDKNSNMKKVLFFDCLNLIFDTRVFLQHIRVGHM